MHFSLSTIRQLGRVQQKVGVKQICTPFLSVFALIATGLLFSFALPGPAGIAPALA
jgi:hypothetical protein